MRGSKEPPVKTGGILEFKQSLSAVFFALHLDIFFYRGFTYDYSDANSYRVTREYKLIFL